MKKVLILIIVLNLFYSCKVTKFINPISGIYENYFENNRDYNHLILRSDFTYTFTQCPNCGDAWFIYFGEWKLKKNKLTLFQGNDITDILNVERIIDYNSDTLIIKIDSSVYRQIPNLKVYIDKETELFNSNGQIIVNKTNYLDNKYDNLAEHFPEWWLQIEKYRFMPTSMSMQQGNRYFTIEYIFHDRCIKINLKGKSIPKNSKKVLIKYLWTDYYLQSISETYMLNKNKLKKKDITSF